MREKVVGMILEAADELSDDLDAPVPTELGETTPLYGEEGTLDSLALTSLVISVEQRITDELGTTVTLADERAMSRSRSAFRTVGTFADHCLEIMRSVSVDG